VRELILNQVAGSQLLKAEAFEFRR
jgi:hypothetical protein